MEPTGLYVHFPFCVSKCPYCDFYSAAGKLRRVDGAAQPGEVTNAILLALGC